MASDTAKILGFAAIIIVIVLLFTTGLQSGQWTTSTGGPTTVVTGTGVYVTTQNGQLVTRTGAYTVTSTRTSPTTGWLGTPWLKLTITGSYSLTDPSGKELFTAPLSIAPLTGTEVVSDINLDASYTVTGEGYDPDTLKVLCVMSGGTMQPKPGDPNRFDTVNTVASVAEFVREQSTTGRLMKSVSVDSLIAGKPWDHERVLTGSVGLACAVTAQILPTFSLIGGGTTITHTIIPVVGNVHMRWYAASVTSSTTTSTPAPTSTSTATTTSTTSPTPVTSTPGNYEPAPTATTQTYGSSVATSIGTTTTTSLGGLMEHERVEKPETERLERQHGYITTRGLQLLGFVPLIEIYGAEAAPSFLESNAIWIIFISGLIALALFLKRRGALT